MRNRRYGVKWQCKIAATFHIESFPTTLRI